VGAGGPGGGGYIKVGRAAFAFGDDGDLRDDLKDTVLMLVDDLNKKGGLLGKKVEAWSSTRLQLAVVR